MGVTPPSAPLQSRPRGRCAARESSERGMGSKSDMHYRSLPEPFSPCGNNVRFIRCVIYAQDGRTVRSHTNVARVASVAFGGDVGDGSIEAYEVYVRFGRKGRNVVNVRFHVFSTVTSDLYRFLPECSHPPNCPRSEEMRTRNFPNKIGSSYVAIHAHV